MHIILGDQITKELEDKYIVLELDNFQIASQDQTISAYCVVENVPLEELPQADRFRDLHSEMIKNYRLGNWKFCEDALEHLQGRWNGEVDSFYQDLLTRIVSHKKDTNSLTDWNPSIKI